jgi:hypothetical protein
MKSHGWVIHPTTTVGLSIRENSFTFYLVLKPLTISSHPLSPHALVQETKYISAFGIVKLVAEKRINLANNRKLKIRS